MILIILLKKFLNFLEVLKEKKLIDKIKEEDNFIKKYLIEKLNEIDKEVKY